MAACQGSQLLRSASHKEPRPPSRTTWHGGMALGSGQPLPGDMNPQSGPEIQVRLSEISNRGHFSDRVAVRWNLVLNGADSPLLEF
jgi:hypothetical protein